MKNERDLIRSKYDRAYPNLFQDITDSLDNASIAYGDNLTKNTKYKTGSTQLLLNKLWDDGLTIEYNKFINDINSYVDQIKAQKMNILSFSTLNQADDAYNKMYSGYQAFFTKWKSETTISSNKWIAHFDKLILAQQPVIQTPQGVALPQPLVQNNNDLLKKIKEIEDKWKLQNIENSALKEQNGSLKEQLKISQDTNTQLNHTINDQKIVIGEQKNTIDDQRIVINDLREDKKDLKEKVTEQKVEIDHLKENLSIQTEKFQEVSDKYVVLKTHFSDLVDKYHVFDDIYVSPIQLAGDNQ